MRGIISIREKTNKYIRFWKAHCEVPEQACKYPARAKSGLPVRFAEKQPDRLTPLGGERRIFFQYFFTAGTNSSNVDILYEIFSMSSITSGMVRLVVSTRKVIIGFPGGRIPRAAN